MLAVGSHDQVIDIYATTFEPLTNGNSSSGGAGGGASNSVGTGAGTGNSASAGALRCQLKVLRRLKGHTSFITQLDWSLDNRLLRSCCASYELLYWDVGVGRQFLSTHDAMEADTQWQTQTCVLGFPVMGNTPSHYFLFTYPLEHAFEYILFTHSVYTLYFTYSLPNLLLSSSSLYPLSSHSICTPLLPSAHDPLSSHPPPPPPPSLIQAFGLPTRTVRMSIPSMSCPTKA